MKKTKKTLVTIISLIILAFFIGPVQADVCTEDYVIDYLSNASDFDALSGCTEITGNLTIEFCDDALTSLSGLESLTSVGGNLTIEWNEYLTSLAGLDNLDQRGQ